MNDYLLQNQCTVRIVEVTRESHPDRQFSGGEANTKTPQRTAVFEKLVTTAA